MTTQQLVERDEVDVLREIAMESWIFKMFQENNLNIVDKVNVIKSLLKDQRDEERAVISQMVARKNAARIVKRKHAAQDYRC